jgi:hypothetical protein
MQYPVPSTERKALECSGRKISLNVPTGTFHFAKNFRPKLLIPGAEFWMNQWNQGVRLWKKCLLSMTLNVY